MIIQPTHQSNSEPFPSSPNETSCLLAGAPMPIPRSRQILISFLSLGICLFWVVHINKINTWFLHSASGFWGSFMSFSMCQYFIHNGSLIIFHCVDGAKFIHSFIHQLLNICVVSAWKLLWIMLFRIINYKIFMDIYVLIFPGHQFLNYMEARCLRNCQTIFSKIAILFYSSISNVPDTHNIPL